jgi:Flp pilus assembly protein TadG
MNVFRRESGQAAVLTAVFLVVLLSMAAFVLDVGSWYRAKRGTQAAADATALAAAQALPDDPSTATGLANQYAAKNGGGMQKLTISSELLKNDTVTVKVSRTSPGAFSKLFGISSVTVGTSATARTGAMGQAKYVAPIVVNKLHPMLNNCGGPCFGSSYATTLPLGKTGAPGAFALVNLENDPQGTIGTSTLANWILHGFDQYLDLGDYFSDTGAKWNSGDVQTALNQRLGTELLFPVYDVLVGSGSNATYHIIAWVGFHLTAVQASGSSGSLSGWFTRVIWTGIQSTKSGTPPALGAYTVSLVQ